jgi:DNA (cytosine-5)-methyltransferase 1
VFVVSCASNGADPAAVLFERESLQGHPAPRREAREGTPGGAPVGALSCNTGPRGHDAGNFACNQAVDAGHLIAPTLDASFARLQGCSGQDLNHGHGHLTVANCLNAHGGSGRLDGESETFIPVGFRPTDGLDCVAHDDLCPSLKANDSPAVAMTFDWQAGGGGADRSFRGKSRSYITDKPGRTRALTANKSLAVAYSETGPGWISEGIGTLRAEGENRPSRPTHTVLTPAAVRRLTPLECERLQGFPDQYSLVKYRGKDAADGNRYRALGNSMAVPVVRWVLARIEQVDLAMRQEDRHAA